MGNRRAPRRGSFPVECSAGTRVSCVLKPLPFEVEAFGVRFKCLDLPTLIRIKEAADRRKDREGIAELRVLLEESEKKQV
jgi:hypothetical protein